MTNIKTMMEELAQEELERDGAACREVMQSRKGAGAHGKMRLINANAMRRDWLENGENEYVYDTNAVLDSIDAQPIVDAVPIDEHRRLCHEFYLQGKMEGAVEAAQGVDAAPVVHGYWTKDDCCSECGADIPSDSWRDYIDKSECLYCYSCGAKMDGELYKRYDAKKGRKPPEGAIPCCEPDPITGHHPHWVKVDPNNPADKHFVSAFERWRKYEEQPFVDGTYEAVGKHFNGNPYNMGYDTMLRHGSWKIDVPRTFEGIREYLKDNYVEGLVFWADGEPQCKIKRTDFGFEWPIKSKEE